MKKRRGKTQGKARRRATKDLVARTGGTVKAGNQARIDHSEFRITLVDSV